jgi:hypothetical protein
MRINKSCPLLPELGQARYRYIRRGINFACRITAVCVKRLPMGWFIVILRKIVRPLSTVNGLRTNPDMNR